MAFKEYSPNPLYQNVPDELWTSGYCAIFANALRERYGVSMRAMVVKSSDGEETMVHTVGVLQDGRYVDGEGVKDSFGYENWTSEKLSSLVFRPANETRVVFEDVDVARLYELSPEDIEDTNAAHEYIDNHPGLFRIMERVVIPMALA